MCLQHFYSCPSGHSVLLYETTCSSFRSTSYSPDSAAPEFVELECPNMEATTVRKPSVNSVNCEKCAEALQKAKDKAINEAAPFRYEYRIKQPNADKLQRAKVKALKQTAPFRKENRIRKRTGDESQEAKVKAMKQALHNKFVAEIEAELEKDCMKQALHDKFVAEIEAELEKD